MRYRLVTLMALRQTVERHYDPNSDNPDVSAKAAGHNKETKARYYKKVNHEEALEAYPNPHQEPMGIHRSWDDINISF